MTAASYSGDYDPAEIERKYKELLPAYERLSKVLTESIDQTLKSNQIDCLGVFSRIKTLESFLEKIERKGCSKPFEQIEDICGIRIVCYYLSDQTRVADLLERELKVIDKDDKMTALAPIAFGYRSIHFIVKIPDAWLNTPQFHGLDLIKAEIQVRTVLSHAWADIEHKLAYKKKDDVPVQFRRQLSMLSAVFEIADSLFEQLRIQRENLIAQLKATSTESKVTGRIRNDLGVNLDSVQALLDSFFRDKHRSRRQTATLVTELGQAGLDLQSLVTAYDRTKTIQADAEKEARNYFRWSTGLSQVAFARLLLMITSDQFDTEVRDMVHPFFIRIAQKYRVQLSHTRRK